MCNHYSITSSQDAMRQLFAISRDLTGNLPRSRASSDGHHLFGFLTTDGNGIVGPVHPKAMPVLLTAADEWDVWLRAPLSEASALQRPLPGEMMRIVGTGEKDYHHDTVPLICIA